MRKTSPLHLAAATALTISLTAGCGNNADHQASPQTRPSKPSPTAAAKLSVGQPADVLGYNMTKIRVTPLAVLYHRGPYSSELDGPENGWYVAITIKTESLEKPDTTAGGMGGGGFQWRGAGQTIDGMDGNASTAPWVGSVPEFGIDSLIEVGDPREGVETFDVPAKGGRLVYLSPEDFTITAEWVLPADSQGTSPAMTKVKKEIVKFS